MFQYNFILLFFINFLIIIDNSKGQQGPYFVYDVDEMFCIKVNFKDEITIEVENEFTTTESEINPSPKPIPRFRALETNDLKNIVNISEIIGNEYSTDGSICNETFRLSWGNSFVIFYLELINNTVPYYTINKNVTMVFDNLESLERNMGGEDWGVIVDADNIKIPIGKSLSCSSINIIQSTIGSKMTITIYDLKVEAFSKTDSAEFLPAVQCGEFVIVGPSLSIVGIAVGVSLATVGLVAISGGLLYHLRMTEAAGALAQTIGALPAKTVGGPQIVTTELGNGVSQIIGDVEVFQTLRIRSVEMRNGVETITNRGETETTVDEENTINEVEEEEEEENNYRRKRNKIRPNAKKNVTLQKKKDSDDENTSDSDDDNKSSVTDDVINTDDDKSEIVPPV